MYRILIVEDEVLLRNELILCEDWAGMGFDPPMLAENGEQGLKMASASQPDVILTDIRMPIRDGLSMIRELTARHSSSLFIVLSGYDDFNYAVEAMRCGVMDYLLKPVDEDRLHMALAEALRRIRECNIVEQEARKNGEQINNLYLQNAIAYIDQHYAEDIRIADVAGALFISDDYLGRLFIREYHMKFTDYLNQVRIQNAIKLLKDPYLKLYHIAQKCGYRDQQYFSNVFKKQMGLTPYQFRHSNGIHEKEG